jgi:phage-related protein
VSIKVPLVSTWNPKALKDAEKDLDSFKGKAGKAFGGLADAGKKIGIGIGAAAAGVGAVSLKLRDAGERAATSNDRIRKIAESMDLFGDNTANVVYELQEYANQVARATGIDQNAIKATQAKLLTFADLAKSADNAGGAFDRATLAAIDLAAAGFGTAEGNAVQLGKALNDPIKGLASLAKSGVTFTEDEKERIKTLVESNQIGEAQSLVLEAIEKQVGGTAEATANASDQMKVAFSQLQERLGLKLLPLFNRLTSFVIEKLVPAVERFAEQAIPFLSEQFEKLRAFLEPIIRQLVDFLVPIIERIVDFVKNNTGTVKAFFAVLAGAATLALIAALVAALVSLFSPFVLIVGGIALLVAAFKFAYDNSKTFRDIISASFKVVQAVITRVIEVVRPIIQGIVDTFQGVVRLIRGLVNGDFREVLGALKDIFTGIIRTVVAQFLALPRLLLEALKSGLSAIGPALVNFGKSIVQKIIDGVKSAAAGIGSAILGAIPGAGAVGNILGGVKKILPFAKGGIVTGPTLGLIGEAGPEAVIPLDRLAGLTGGGTTINISGALDPVAVARQIREILDRDAQRQGIAF